MSTVNTQQIYQQAKVKGQCMKAFIQDTMKAAKQKDTEKAEV